MKLSLETNAVADLKNTQSEMLTQNNLFKDTTAMTTHYGALKT